METRTSAKSPSRHRERPATWLWPWLCAASCGLGACGSEAADTSGGGGGAGGSTSVEPVCGDGVIEGDELCDAGPEDPCGLCSDDCRDPGPGPTCGDGLVCQGQESCDDGNSFDGDFCSPNCGEAGLCTEDPANLGLYGSTIVPTCRDLVPLCNLQVILANEVEQAVTVVDVDDTFGDVASHPLGATPTSLALDPLRGLLYVGVGSAPGLQRLDMASGVLTPIPVPAPVLDVVVAEGSWVMAVLDDPSVSPMRSVALVNGEDATVESVVTDGFGALLVYDHARKQLVSGERGAWPGALRRHAFDPVAGTLTLTQELADAGDNCRDLAISPDGQHLVFMCAAGNDGMNAVFDFDPGDLTHVKGKWQMSSNPRAAAFNPLRPILLVAGEDEVATFDTDTYGGWGSSVNTGCWLLGKVGFAPGGSMFYGLDDCLYGDDPVQDLTFYAVDVQD